MKKSILSTVCSLTLSALILTSAQAANSTDDALFDATIAKQQAHSTTNSHLGLVPAAPKLDVKGHILIDATTGKIITEGNSRERLAPASLTKIMSLYVISQSLKSGQIRIDDQVRISKSAASTQGSKMFLKEGENVPVRELLQGIIVDSGNDATYAMAEYIAGSENSFVDLMNQEAKAIGMTDSHFVDCTGMPNKDHYTTARDMAILSSAIINDFPEYYPYYSQKWFTFNNIKQPNRNRLLWRYKYADGIKTGHTSEAGYCLAASAKNDDMRLISIVLGAPTEGSRADASERLLTYGFRFFKTYKLYSFGDTVASPRIWKGKEKNLPLGINESIFITIPRGQYDNLKITTTLEDPLMAPVTKGQRVGVLRIALGNDKLAETPLIALQTIQRGSLWARIQDSVSMILHNMFSSDDEA